MKCQTALRSRLQCTRRPHHGQPQYTFRNSARGLSLSRLLLQNEESFTGQNQENQKEHHPKHEGAMSRKLEEMAEEAMIEGGKSARKNMQEAGFSGELKEKLEERIRESSFKNDHAAAFSLANMPSSAGKGTQDMAIATPWAGNESVYDTSLRMLDDASKPIRVPFKIPQPGYVSPPAAKPKLSAGQRIAKARDKTTNYSMSNEVTLSEKEREAFRNEVRDRFGAGVYSAPLMGKGLSSIANEQIEDARARGQFKNIPRGKGKNVERDPTADSPYLDTTEYFMNRILQSQEVTPEWIQKQQEMKLEVSRFRTWFRDGWRTHAGRLIANQGGSVEMQVRRAEAYAAAEARDKNPEQSLAQNESSNNKATASDEPMTAEPLPNLSPLRDPQYFAIEKEYYELKIKKLNQLIRSYNLQAPRMAQRGYLNIQRETNYCYTEVAPTLPDEIQRRATQKVQNLVSPAEKTHGGIQSKLGLNQRAPVYDEDRSKGYGFKQLWRDWWG